MISRRPLQTPNKPGEDDLLDEQIHEDHCKLRTGQAKMREKSENLPEEKPVAPGEEGVITAIYNSKGRPGNFTKTITVKHNGEGETTYLTIRGFVESAPKEQKSPVQNQ